VTIEVGDEVVCTIGTKFFTKGKAYKVLKVKGEPMDTKFKLKSDDGNKRWSMDYRWELKEPVQLEFDFSKPKMWEPDVTVEDIQRYRDSVENAPLDYEQLTRDTKMLNEYQQDIEQFIMCEGDARLLENTLGIAGEAGEVTEKIKKHVRDGTPLDKDGVIKELGDVLFYVAALATHLDEDLSEVAAINIEKLRDRKARGVIQGSGDCR